MMVSLGFPTSLIPEILDQMQLDKENYKDYISSLKNMEFWLFFTGIYKDRRSGNAYHFLLTYLCLFIGLIFEKKMIDWLTDRFGCSY
jgi:hypothetical protein